MQYILNLVSQYGYILIYLLPTIELIGVPFLPGEILMLYCGYLIFKGQLNFALCLFFGSLGVMSGLTISYVIGKKLGRPFFDKYGAKIHLHPSKIDKLTNLLNRFGTLLIFFICFIPGLKHIIGYVTGMSNMTYKKYAIGGYVGAFFWAFTFLFIGKTLGNRWSFFHTYMKRYLIIGAIIFALLVLVFYLIRIFRKEIKEFLINLAFYLLNIFKSLDRVRIFVLLTSIILIVFLDAFFNIVSGLLSNDFSIFNNITLYIIDSLFKDFTLFNLIFKGISFFTLDFIYIIAPAILLLFLFRKKEEFKGLYMAYTLITILGGFLVLKATNYIFSIVSVYIPILSDFLNDKCFTVIVIYGFFFYVLFKHTKKTFFKKLFVILFLVISILTGLSELFYFNSLSSVLSGYCLGLSWVALNIILLEIGKVLPSVKFRKRL